MNILVTGGTGFIGSAFVRLAREHGHRIGALARPETIQTRGLRDEQNLTWLPGTVAEPPLKQIAAFQPKVCLHAAWIATPGVYLESPENEDWVRWSLSFLRQVREAGARRIVALGTCIEYEIKGREKLREDSTPIAPQSVYARCKNQLRLALETEAQAEGFSLCWGRVFYPYGPGEHSDRLCSSLIRKLSRGGTVTLKTPHSTKDYIYIDDLASAIMAVVQSNRHGAINLGTGTATSVRDIARTITTLIGRPVGLVQGSTSSDIDPLAYVIADSIELRNLAWQPKVSMIKGLSRLIGYLAHLPEFVSH